ncbi:hypothetical protein [Haloparvum alkalitolerans]|uniref:hypothetical protein n=1 Tax=Haloparvum alkalitolerans TaxID=1042953 RepID=UPI003CEE4563
MVVDTDPVVIEVEADGPGEEPQLLTLENAPPVAEGQNVIVAGELTDDGTLQVDPDRAIVREPWEVLYMYGISTFAALLIAGRGINGWTVDRETWSVVPRDVPLHERLRTKEARDD